MSEDNLPLPGESECDCGLNVMCDSPGICAMMMRNGMFPSIEEVDQAREERKKLSRERRALKQEPAMRAISLEETIKIGMDLGELDNRFSQRLFVTSAMHHLQELRKLQANPQTGDSSE